MSSWKCAREQERILEAGIDDVGLPTVFRRLTLPTGETGSWNTHQGVTAPL